MKFKLLSIIGLVVAGCGLSSCVATNSGYGSYGTATASLSVLPTGYRTVYVGGESLFLFEELLVCEK